MPFGKQPPRSLAELKKVNSPDFEAEVLEASTPVLVDFGAVWCGPCKMLDPVVQELAGEWGEKIKVVKVDIDHNPDIAIKYQIMGVPTLMMFVDGQPRERMTGYQPKKRVVKKFQAFLG